MIGGYSRRDLHDAGGRTVVQKCPSSHQKRLIQTILHAPVCSQGTSGCLVPLSSRRVVRFLITRASLGISLALLQDLRRAMPAAVTGSPSHATCDSTRAIQEGDTSMAVTHRAIRKRSIMLRWLRKVLLFLLPGPHAPGPRETQASRHPQDDFWASVTPHMR